MERKRREGKEVKESRQRVMGRLMNWFGVRAARWGGPVETNWAEDFIYTPLLNYVKWATLPRMTFQRGNEIRKSEGSFCRRHGSPG